MGNHKKLKLSDVIPNARSWFFMKLKQISTKSSSTSTTTDTGKRKKTKTKTKTKKKTHQSQSASSPAHVAALYPPLSPSRKSYHFTRQLTTTNKTTPTTSPESFLVNDRRRISPPRKSTRRKTKSPTTTSGRNEAVSSATASTTPTTTSSSSTATTASTSTTISTGWDNDFHPKPPQSQPPSTAYKNSTKIDVDSSNHKIQLTSREREYKLDSKTTTLPPIKTEQHRKKLNTKTTRQTSTTTTTATSASTTGTHNKSRQLRNSIPDESVILVTPAPASSPTITRRFPTGSPGIRLRINSPRIARIPLQGRRKSFSSSTHNNNTPPINSKSRTSNATTGLILSSESLAIVKSSSDPQTDFRESMMEMIIENEIKSHNELEDLLACYLSLNADEYHDVIINVFKQIWFDLKRL